MAAKKGTTTGQEATDQKSLKPRPPIVVVVGHVDHGKTTLLDYIRKTTVAEREAGGITQATAAYEIEHAPEAGGPARKITFIDTPGHEAFTAMRSRGAQAADLAILVIAADEGVKPQTKEAIAILNETKTPFIVAFNKIDKLQGSAAAGGGAGGGGLEKAKTDVMNAGVMLEGYGGTVSYHGISAKTGEGVGDLLDLVLLATDMEHLTYDPAAPAAGFVLEARRDPRRGNEAAVIIKEGTLRRGDPIATATARGKVKILENFLGKTADALTPSAPALIIGLETLPKVGEVFAVGGLAASKHAAHGPLVGGAAKPAQGVPVDAAATAAKPGGAKPENVLNLILTASDAGSLEALAVVLRGIPPAEGKEVNVVAESVGDVTDGIVKHAIATKATIVGFKNRVEKGAQTLAEAQSVSIITSKIVYDLSKAVQEFLAGTLVPIAGELEVLAVFNQEKLDKQLVGGRVTQGVFRGKAQFDIMRAPAEGGATAPAGTGRALGLREKKSEVAQAEKGEEIGVLANSQTMIQVGDKLVIKNSEKIVKFSR